MYDLWLCCLFCGVLVSAFSSVVIVGFGWVAGSCWFAWLSLLWVWCLLFSGALACSGVGFARVWWLLLRIVALVGFSFGVIDFVV